MTNPLTDLAAAQPGIATYRADATPVRPWTPLSEIALRPPERIIPSPEMVAAERARWPRGDRTDPGPAEAATGLSADHPRSQAVTSETDGDSKGVEQAKRLAEMTDAELLDALGDIRIGAWWCPTPGHSDRTGPDGRPVITVTWIDGVAHCTWPGCGRTSQPAARPRPAPRPPWWRRLADRIRGTNRPDQKD